MTSAHQITYRRQRRRIAARRNPLGKLGLGCAVLVSLLIALGSFLAAFAYANLSHNLPSVEVLPSLLEPPDGRLWQPTRLYDRNGENVLLVLQHPAASKRQYLYGSPDSLTEAAIPEDLITATLAAADPQFWDHGGAPLSSLVHGERSTLAKRLATDMLLGNEAPGLARALRAQLLGTQITARFGREKVLEWYLNSANYGRLAYGADAAARVYFGIPANELNLAEGAMLAAAGEAPELNPMDAPQAALERQKRIIQNMLRYRLITPEEGIQAARAPLTFRDPARQGQALSIQELEPDLAHAFSRLVLMQLETQIGRSKLERGGLKIITTLDYDLQSAATCLSQIQRARLSGAPDIPGGEEVGCEAARLLSTLGDSPGATTRELQSDIVMLDPKSGQILALVGNAPIGPTDEALGSHPAGSLATPFLYLTAFTRGLSPGSLIWDVPPDTAELPLQNFDGQHHGPMRLRIALANDYLVPARKVLTQVGVNNVRHTLRQFALSIPVASAESNSPLDLLEQANLVNASQAFGVFANQGVLAGRSLEDGEKGDSRGDLSPLDPLTIQKVMDLDGNVLLDWSLYERRPIITPQLAYLMTDVLSDEPVRWPSLGHPNPLEVGRPTAAKLSRTFAGESHWAIGYTPQLVVGVWLGYGDKFSSLGPEISATTLGNAAAELWHAVTQYAHKDLAYQAWDPPDGISLIEVCDPSGDLPTRYCPNTVAEVFLSGNEPVQSDTLYHAISINTDSGRLATVFTPPELIQESVYMRFPPEATLWAQETGRESPPQVYDTIPASLPEYDQAVITEPANFALVRGSVDISGAAGGEDFEFYRVQVGKGMYPQEWLQVEQEVTQATTGQLGSWDTGDLNGLYSIQLLVVRQDQSVERVNLLVTVDNQPPEVRIAAPLNEAIIDLGSSEKIVLRAEASDDIGLQSVIFYLNDEQLETRIQPPFAFSWRPEVGEYYLRVVATDQAGNTNDDAITFVVK